MLQYIGTDKEAPGVNVTGLLYGNPNQLLLQIYGAAFIIVLNAIATFIILRVISSHRAAAHGRGDPESGRRRGSRRNRLCDRSGRRVAGGVE